MHPSQVLLEHDSVCQDVHQCVLDENRFLRQYERAPNAAMIERKTALRARLETSLAAIRELPAASAHDVDTRALLEKTRSRILQVLHLDRENEQLLLRCSLSARRVTPAAPSSSLLQYIYGRR